LNRDGQELADHSGVHRFTVGQRRGLGVALGEPAFVTAIDGDRGTVTVGPAGDVMCDGAEIVDTTWANDVRFPLRAQVKVRSHHEPVEAMIERSNGNHNVLFTTAVRAVSPGQIAVAYDGERVLGGGTIRSATRNDAVPAGATP
jgi:tRNA-specific 2-thiouridylase